jgi:hypothetical protein
MPRSCCKNDMGIVRSKLGQQDEAVEQFKQAFALPQHNKVQSRLLGQARSPEEAARL